MVTTLFLTVDCILFTIGFQFVLLINQVGFRNQ